LHDQSPAIICRDLKPGNIMLEKDTGLLKIIDFGIALFQRKGKRNYFQVLQDPDEGGIGTMGYAPPEQWQKGKVTTQSDVYGLGVVLHQLLTLYDPTTTPFALPPIQQKNPAVPQPIADVIAKAYALMTNERYQTIADFQRDLMQVWRSSLDGW